ncbi:MAG TPA: RNA polymerase sigma factor [Bacteroidales bacterium]|nr:RNA polymerase sigma factor [Bacteroidales bacterium]
METQNLQILIEGCLKNDRNSQKQIYDLYKNAMYSVCLRICADCDDAKDALQEGFVEVFKCINAFRSESSLGAWIKTIMVRRAIRKLKKLKFEKFPANLHEPIEFESDISGEELHKAILMLDEGYRSVFVLYEVEGYSHQEISRILKISEGTSKSQLHYAKKKLQLILQKIYGYER